MLSQRYLRGWCRSTNAVPKWARAPPSSRCWTGLRRSSSVCGASSNSCRCRRLTHAAYSTVKNSIGTVLDHHVDRHRGVTPENAFIAPRPRHARDAAAFLIDLSASTDDGRAAGARADPSSGNPMTIPVVEPIGSTGRPRAPDHRCCAIRLR
jgi:hypothetical protein